MHLLDYRINSGNRYENYNGELDNPGQWFARWVETELGWGTQVVELTPTRIHTQTTVLSAEDTMIFTGTEEEMAPFVKAAAFTVFFTNQQLKDGFKNELPMVMSYTEGNPLTIAMASGFLLGKGRAKSVCLALLCEQDVDCLDRYRDIPLKDLIVMTQMYLFENATHDDLKAVAY